MLRAGAMMAAFLKDNFAKIGVEVELHGLSSQRLL